MATAPQARIRLPIQDARVEDLLLWRDVRKSGMVLGGATAAYLLLQFAKINLLGLTLYALSTLVFAMLIWRVLGGVAKRPPPALPKVLSEGVGEPQVRAFAERLTPAVNRALALAHRALSGREPLVSLATAGGLYAAAMLASRVSLITLAYLPVLAAMAVPKVYELRKDEIDRGIDSGRGMATSAYDQFVAPVVARIPRAAAASPASSSTRKVD